MDTTTRHSALNHQIERLDRRLESLRQLERRFAWYRLVFGIVILLALYRA